ncbi:hypothetical protein HM1_1216 [Heliomicrobium modesticaldum Ice1]|uniref:Uncharacterized protein n=1 Tax=Heliobacterium modesticaldum (strain ATCC 51547 / Ice1) TaxID=498761 RepID=B0TH33_HELMI|nr:hypothetical protein [Heliomicrobium modesticaldum]ABZ83358.1 hypothetical protein HM1_1216 [Heliomicrobium modesticaldum Ice1]
MKLWLDEEYIGEASEAHQIEALLNEWLKRHPERVIARFQYAEQSFDYGEAWDLLIREESNVTPDKEARLITQSRDTALLELAESVKEYVQRLVRGLPDLADRFYRGEDAGAWEEMEALAEGLSFLDTSAILLAVDSYDQGRFVDLLSELEQAMLARDTVFIGDLLKYELTPWLEGIQKSFIEN